MLILLCVYALYTLQNRLDVWNWFYFSRSKWKYKEYRIENLLSRCRYHFGLLCLCLYARSFTQRSCSKSPNPNEIRKHRRNFLGNDVAIKHSVDIIHRNFFVRVFFLQMVISFGVVARCFCHMKSFCVFYGWRTILNFKSNIKYVESLVWNVRFLVFVGDFIWIWDKIHRFQMKYKKKKRNKWQPVETNECIVACIRFWIDGIFSVSHTHTNYIHCSAYRLHESLSLLSVFVYTNTSGNKRQKSTMSLLFDSVGSQSNNTRYFVMLTLGLLLLPLLPV